MNQISISMIIRIDVVREIDRMGRGVKKNLRRRRRIRRRSEEKRGK